MKGCSCVPCCRNQVLEKASTETSPRGAVPAAAPASSHRDGASAETSQRALTAFLNFSPSSEEELFLQQLEGLKALPVAKRILCRTVVQPVAFSTGMHFNDYFPLKKLFLLGFLCLTLSYYCA